MKCNILDIVDFYNMFPNLIGKIQVETINGYKDIQYAAMTAKNSKILQIKLDDGKLIECSPEHLLMKNNKWVKANALLEGQFLLTIEGYVKIISILELDYTEDLYDIQVDGEQYIANGIVSHNSTIIEGFVYCLSGRSYRGSPVPRLINTINQKIV